MTDMLPESRSAATVVILRDRPGAAAEILMMERASSMAFAAGALVFPGGAVDAGDHALAERIAGGLPVDEAAARIAAVRETLEESGLAIGLASPPPPDRLPLMRQALAAGMAFGEMLEEHGLEIALDRIVRFALWNPSRLVHAQRVFVTRFYISRSPK